MKRIRRAVVYDRVALATQVKHPRPMRMLRLECGHIECRPLYVRVPRRVICLDCEIGRISR